MHHPHPELAAASASAATPATPDTGSEAATPSRRALGARRILLGALLLGVLADPLLRTEPWGLGLPAWMAVFAAVSLSLARRHDRALSAERIGWLAVALVFAAGLAWRDAGILLFFDLLAMLVALGLLAMSFGAMPVPGLALARVRDLVRAAFGTGLEVATGAVPLVLRDAELHAAPRPASAGRLGSIARALGITAPLLLVFTLLLTRADPIFGSFFRLPDVELDVVLSHIVIAGFFGWVTAGWLRRALLVRPGELDTAPLPLPFALNATDVTLALGALNVLFAAFVVVQIGWLFGGEALVLRTTGLGYAEYARRGFFELTGVAALLLPVLLAAQALIPAPDARTIRRFRRLALSLVALLGVMLVSAAARMRLYIAYYGISADRLYATAFMIWLSIVFGWLVLTVLRARPRKFAAGMVLSGFAVLVTLNALNPDALVARANLARAEGGRAGAAGADPVYLASLGGDAVPMLVSALIAPAGTSIEPAERCAAASRLLERWTGDRRERMTRTWTQWNAGRARALRAVRTHETELRQLACPAPQGA
jgi:hypothetical protein